MTIALNPSLKFCVMLSGTFVLAQFSRNEGSEGTHDSPTILESTLNRLKISPSPFSTNSTSCRSALAYVSCLSLATMRCPESRIKIARPAFAAAPIVNAANKSADACAMFRPNGICYDQSMVTTI